MAEHNELGRFGEDLATKYLESHGYSVLFRNKRIGKEEIDIVAEKGGGIHCIEVKSVKKGSLVAPEDNLSPAKIRHVFRGVKLLVLDGRFRGKRVQVDAILLTVDYASHTADITMLHNLVEE